MVFISTLIVIYRDRPHIKIIIYTCPERPTFMNACPKIGKPKCSVKVQDAISYTLIAIDLGKRMAPFHNDLGIRQCNTNACVVSGSKTLLATR